MQCVIAFASLDDFRSASSQLKQYLLSIFGTWLQSRINEQANKVLRDSERAKSASKVSFRMCNAKCVSNAGIVVYLSVGWGVGLPVAYVDAGTLESDNREICRWPECTVINFVSHAEVSSNIANWHDLHVSDVIAMNGRDEVQSEPIANPPPVNRMERLFVEGCRLKS
jgi:hypothetical protein